MQKPLIGFIPIIRTTFDVPYAQKMTATAREKLAVDFDLIEPVEAATTPEEAQAAAQALAETPPDLLLIFQATFADSGMVMTIAEQVDAALMLWAIPEPHTGGRLRLNSLCGINLGGHALKRAGHNYDYIYAAPDDPAALEKIAPIARAAQVRRRLQGARLGRVGENPNGFDTCKFDPAALRERVGIEIVQIDLQTGVFDAAKHVQRTEPETVERVGAALGERVGGLDTVDADATQGTLSTYVTLRQMAEDQNLQGFSVRCWPEFFTELGCAACGAMSMLSDEMTPCSCEADVNGTITQMMLQGLSGGPAFGTDMVSVEREADAMVIWHCGLAPLSMADEEAEKPGVTIHSNRKLPLLMEFPLKPGRVTVARLSESGGDGNYRLVVSTGQILAAPKSFSGTTGLLKFDRPAGEVLDTIMQEGLEHHISITYGDHAPALVALANMLDLPVVWL